MPGSDKLEYDFLEGEVLLVDKPLEWTSFDVVKKIRNALKRKLDVKKIKVGHAGTLDPLATGLLIICTGKATKRLSDYSGLDKEYTGTLTLGATTPSYDRETVINQHWETGHLNEEDLYDAAKKLTGTLQQLPPIYSAIRVKGERLYHLAREGKPAEVKPRQVQVYSFEITQIHMPDVSFKVRCSKGTYIRSLAHDFGRLLNNGAYLSALCRTAIGPYKLSDAWQLPELLTLLSKDEN